MTATRSTILCMRIAVAQLPGTRLADWPRTLEAIEQSIRQAATLRAELVVLPECVWPAYFLESRQVYLQARASGLPGSDQFLALLSGWAIAAGVAVCAGYVEKLAPSPASPAVSPPPGSPYLYNSAALVAADGQLIGVQRKRFLWDFDHNWFEPACAIEALSAPFGRVGLMICADARLPEIPATLAMRGVQLILQPTAWVNAGAADQPWNPQPEFLIPARAEEFGVPIVSASKWGREGPVTFVGSSLICGADGRVLAACGPAETAVVAADVELRAARPPSITLAQREILARAGAPPAADVSPLNVVLLPAAPVPPRGARVGMAHRGDAPAEEIAVHTAVLHTLMLAPPGSAGALESVGKGGHREPGERTEIEQGVSERMSLSDISDTDALYLPAPTNGIVALGAARIAGLPAEAARDFVALRCLALQGVHLVVLFGAGISEHLVRARACENRVFVVWVRAADVLSVDPAGRVLSRATWPATVRRLPTWTLPLQVAANKEVVAQTDVIGGRRPGLYAS